LVFKLTRRIGTRCNRSFEIHGIEVTHRQAGRLPVSSTVPDGDLLLRTEIFLQQEKSQKQDRLVS
jgi:hypothetical protein